MGEPTWARGSPATPPRSRRAYPRRMPDLTTRPRLALALGGGGVRGAAHLGVLRALDDAGLEVQGIAGTSSGAVAALLYALERAEPGRGRADAWVLIESVGARGYAELHRLLAGKPGDGLAERLRTLVGWERLLRTGVLGPGVASLGPMRSALAALVGNLEFEDLALPLAFVATDLLAGERHVLRSGRLVDAALASSAVPGIFPPVELDGRLLVDGHVVDNVPAEVARELVPDAVVLAVDVGYDPPPAPPRTALETILRAATVSREHLRRTSVAAADVLLSVGEELPTGLFDVDRAPDLLAAGYALGRSIVPDLRERLRPPEPPRPGWLRFPDRRRRDSSDAA